MSQNEPKWADLLPAALRSAPAVTVLQTPSEPLAATAVHGEGAQRGCGTAGTEAQQPFSRALITTPEPHKFTSCNALHNHCIRLHKSHINWPLLLSSDPGQQSRDRCPCYMKLARTSKSSAALACTSSQTGTSEAFICSNSDQHGEAMPRAYRNQQQ